MTQIMLIFFHCCVLVVRYKGQVSQNNKKIDESVDRHQHAIMDQYLLNLHQRN